VFVGLQLAQPLAILVYTILNSRIDYCNTVLAGAPRTVTDKLQRVLKAAAQVFASLYFDLILSLSITGLLM